MGDTPAELHIVGIGNAIVDVLCHGTDELIARHGLPKGSMTLIDAERAEALHAATSPAVEISGGSSANTMVAAASFGSPVAYIGKVRDDPYGHTFTHGIRAAGVRFDTPHATTGAATARCYVMVSPEGERTMSTYLGACVDLGPEDVDESLIACSQVTYLEGYLWDRPRAKAALLAASAAAHTADRTVALTLSDTFCVERHRQDLLSLVREEVDVLFANEDEIRALYQTDALPEALDRAQRDCVVSAITRSRHGSVVVSQNGIQAVPAEPVRNVVDTTGAGDCYAAGFLHGFATGQDLRTCARLGSVAAAEIITHLGARPRQN
ncbi:MAG: adenosine kinase [Streptosporangiaceae bacterium]